MIHNFSSTSSSSAQTLVALLAYLLRRDLVVLSVVGILHDEVDPYADIGGLEAQIQEIKEAAVANSASATFLRVVGSELIHKYLGDGPKLVRELFRVADDLSLYVGTSEPA
ncbi:core protein [Raphanus sativus]|nr:core protein [Raphanus sativus]